MKVLIAVAVLFALGATAQARLPPLERQMVTTAADNAATDRGPSYTTHEADYFRAPQPATAGRIFPCRLQLGVFEKTRLAQSCN